METILLINGERSTFSDFMSANYEPQSDDSIIFEDVQKVSRMDVGDVVFIGISEIKRIK